VAHATFLTILERLAVTVVVAQRRYSAVQALAQVYVAVADAVPRCWCLTMTVTKIAAYSCLL
jgi:hypothetical protein